MNSQLTVYKASAGSGKTFTLAREYMTLVIDNPHAYRTILAVTFTNKATEEMKLRILGQLYGIAHELPESDQYLVQIHAALPHLSEKQIRKNAEEALRLLIHNYNYFRVETIDTFFQSVLRNLARELDLTANLRIGLNDYQVEQQAVDELIESLESTDKLLFWIMDYIKENIADDKSWNVIGQIKSFGEHIFRDYYKEHADELSKRMEEEGFFEAFKDKMKETRNQAKEQFEEIAASFFDALEEEGYSADDLNNKTRGIWSYFNKLRNGKYGDDDVKNMTLAKCLDNPENWVKKSEVKNNSPLYQHVVNTLYPILQFSEEHRHMLERMYKSANLTIKHLNQLRLLGSIDKKVREMNQEANRFLLSDTQTLLHSLIQGSDSPFIFEKIGTQLNHVMIDEFQDTSTIQWKNFKVLLQETMSHQNAGNLIVGDVKQSIYRWRSGDWRLLNNIESEFPSNYTIQIESLSHNYRSDRNIVDFNNAFFEAAAEKEYQAITDKDLPHTFSDSGSDSDGSSAAQLKKAYSDVRQRVPQKKTACGYVRINLLGQKGIKEDENSENYQDKMMGMILDTINELVEAGVKYKNIAILVRSNKTIQNIADYLMANSATLLPLVSDEAFRLDASQAVNVMVTALRCLAHPNDDIAKAGLMKFCMKYLQDKQIAEKFLEERELYLQKPLLDLTESLYTYFKLGEIETLSQQSSYVSAFYDQLASYLSDNGGDIDDFLNEWDENIHSKSIHSDKADGIRLLSIHKSKGLEFDNVIMPFCDWALEKTDTIWCTPQVAPFNELPLVPVDFSAKKMVGSIYEKDYYQEHLQNMVDNLNLLYVGFTRAGKNLFVYGKRGAATQRSFIIEDSLEAVYNTLNAQNASGQYEEQTLEFQGNGTDKKTDDVYFEYGEIDASSKEEAFAENKNVFMQKSADLPIQIKVKSDLYSFKPSLQSEFFMHGDESEEQQKFYIKIGTVLHELFSKIKTKDDVESVLKQLELDGVLYDENISKEKIEKMLRARLNSPLVSEWFSDKWKVLNETSILYLDKDGKVCQDRPDRVLVGENEIVVIDFKFGKPHAEYHDQVRQYMSQLKGMGYSCVKGYLWYVYPNKMENVVLED